MLILLYIYKTEVQLYKEILKKVRVLKVRVLCNLKLLTIKHSVKSLYKTRTNYLYIGGGLNK